MWTFKLAALFIIAIATVLGGWYPFVKKIKTQEGHDYPIADSLACGIFLGAGLIHMLNDAAVDFYELKIDYPLPFVLAGLTFLGLLLLEHLGREIYEHKGANSKAFAVLAVIMLSIHSFLEGAAVGLTDSLSIIIIMSFAIIAHKWAASFALAVRINKSEMSLSSGLKWFALFTIMTPLGILGGVSVEATMGHYPMIEPIFTSLAAGTFLYLGTLHGLEKATLITQCCDLKRYYFVILGFAIMAIVAYWV